MSVKVVHVTDHLETEINLSGQPCMNIGVSMASNITSDSKCIRLYEYK